MKNAIIGLIMLGIAGLGYSQDNGVQPVELEEVNISPLNLTYLNAVQDHDTPTPAKELENFASRYDITKDPIFDRNFEAYEVIFKETGGRIVATYDQQGKILSSLEKFENIALPAPVRNTIFQNFPGWTVHKDSYLVSYWLDGEVKKIYKVQVRKDNKRKNLKMDRLGNFIK